MESEDELDMHDAHDDDDDDNEENFYSGGDDDAAAIDSDDADVGDYEFVDNDSDDSDDMVSYRHQVDVLRVSNFFLLFWVLMVNAGGLLIVVLYSLLISISGLV